MEDLLTCSVHCNDYLGQNSSTNKTVSSTNDCYCFATNRGMCDETVVPSDWSKTIRLDIFWGLLQSDLQDLHIRVDNLTIPVLLLLIMMVRKSCLICYNIDDF